MRKAPIRVVLASVALLVASCSGAAGGGGGGGEIGAAPAADANLTLVVYSKFTDREEKAVTAALQSFTKKFPNIKIDHRGNQDDDKLTQSIQSGSPPDVAISFFSDNLGNWCHSGAFQDLNPYIQRDKVDLNVIPKQVRDYTAYNGKQCSMPFLADVYGFYYNKDMLTAAGISGPPKTTAELLDYAKRTTKFAADGSIEVAGFIPSMPFYANEAQIWAPMWGATYLSGPDGKSAMASSPQWKELFDFQKQLVDFYGKDKLERFKAGLGDQYSPDNAFHKKKLAMMFDGEYRNAFLADTAPDVNYGTAPPPVSASRTSQYGGGYSTGTIIGMPKGVKNPGASWELIKHVTLDTDTLVELSNQIKNLPSTTDSLSSPNLKVNEQFKTFLDMYGSGKLQSNPASPVNAAAIKAVNDFASRWIAGQEPDLAAGLAKVDAQINDELAQKLGK
ncbi:extracellular solute-binding protein [Kibdelosporangium philippinense]|uniref:Extracellular solute-binding protein n=1 Tax=Kibdelosporangium philippinense TaxID=211113 RepID=A0ABS8Z7I6_9PSEU|nr:extracellular solute-binding protein [Kibdelosporangium philippinense]MCE7003367.1 extracellular solute-binding protein [Kibdelosporangium philippinense]